VSGTTEELLTDTNGERTFIQSFNEGFFELAMEFGNKLVDFSGGCL
jgi:hypothetical protein